MLSYFRSLTGAVLGRELTREDVQPVLDQMKDHLIKKNVAVEIAQKICESVAANLIGKQLGSFTRSYLKHTSQKSVSKLTVCFILQVYHRQYEMQCDRL